MAYGQKQLFVAFPQPGTTNAPVGGTVRNGKFGGTTWIPPFAPVTATVVDTASAGIAAFTAVLEANIASVALQIGNGVIPGTLAGELAQISYNLSRIADTKKSLAKSLSDLNVALGTIAVAKSEGNAVASMATAKKIQTDNLYKAASGDTPELPPIKDMIKEALKDSGQLSNAAAVSGFVNNQVKKSVGYLGTWISGTSAYQTVEGYLKNAKDSVLSVELPSSASILSRTKSSIPDQTGPM
jgi:uncharacterized protein (DUF2342 family)